MDIRDYVRVLRVRWRLILASTLLGLLVATSITFLSSPIYEAKAQLFVSTSQSAADTGSGLNQGGQFAQQRVKSYAEILNGPMVTEPVVKELGLPYSAQALAGRITASAPLDTVLIDVSVRDGSAAQAQRIADAVATRFADVVGQLETPTGGATSTVKVSVVRSADRPSTPVSPRPALNLALGLLVGLAVGVGAAVLRETLDTTVKAAHEIPKLLDVASLGIIGFDADAGKRPLIVHSDPHSTRAEAFRQLRTNLQFVDIDAPPRSIVVTSSLPSEGKSTTTCNLAITLAQAGVRVALVEADLRRPRIAEYLGLEGAVGLTDVLVGRAELDDVLQSWGPDSLFVRPSGATPPNPSELLGSQHMRSLLGVLESRVDLVLVDAPPLLPVTDAAIVAAQVSGTILVLRAGKTTREQVTRAVEALRAVDARIYGAVLNMVPTKGPDAYRYNYYGYGPDRPAAPAQRSPDSAAPRAVPTDLPASTTLQPVSSERKAG